MFLHHDDDVTASKVGVMKLNVLFISYELGCVTSQRECVNSGMDYWNGGIVE